jgi:formylglycine-generating enzyme required for sulfatase activity
MTWRSISGLSLGILLATLVNGDPPRPVTPEQIRDLITQLGDRSYERREQAAQELQKLGPPVLRAIREAHESTAEPEIARRAEEIELAILRAAANSSTTGMKMGFIREGKYSIGSPPEESGRQKDEHQATITMTKPFLLGSYEVTQKQYQDIMGTNPSYFRTGSGGAKAVAELKMDLLPVENVTWFDAVEFCNRLSIKEGRKPYYKISDVKKDKDRITLATVEILGGSGYRLPTEAEWEVACRAKTTTPYHYGDRSSAKTSNLTAGKFSGGYGGSYDAWPNLNRTNLVGSYPANEFRLHEMHGNVMEWCQDWYDEAT